MLRSASTTKEEYKRNNSCKNLLKEKEKSRKYIPPSSAVHPKDYGIKHLCMLGTSYPARATE
jgi:hypothetical protein